MAYRNDLLNQRFGKLTVIRATDQREQGYQMWECRCDCGNTVLVNTKDLKRKKNISCGCTTPKYPARRGKIAEDLEGQRFGMLTVLRRGESRKGRACWICVCDCGNTCEVRAAQLKSGKTRSCGCLRREVERNKKDITGQRFGRLTALYPTSKRNYKGCIYWHCRCDCGNEVDLTEDNLVYGNYVSCGCRRKEIQKNVRDTLHFVDGTCIEWLRSRKNRVDNTSGFRGVYRRRDNLYRVGIGFKGRKFHLGIYQTYEDAVRVRLEAEQFIHDEYVQRYEEWAKKLQEARDSGQADWESENPLIFEVQKPAPGILQIETNEGLRTLHY